jgi:integrase
MPREKSGARIVKWRGHFHLFYFDHIEGKQKRVRCEKMEAYNASQRRELVREYQSREANEAVEAVKRGGSLSYSTPLLDGIKTFRAHLDERVKARAGNPEAREGLSPQSAKELRATLDLLEVWLKIDHQGLTTGSLDGPTLQAFFTHLAVTPTRNGNRKIKRSAATLNKHRRNVKSLLNHLNELRPPKFPDFAIFKKALQPLRTEMQPPVAFEPDVLKVFLTTAIEYGADDRAIAVTRVRPKSGVEKFTQRRPQLAATPVSRVFLMLALTGRRLQDVLSLRWEDVDLETGRITFRSSKTGSIRIVPMIGAPEGDVAPGLWKLIQKWRKEDMAREFVLPHGSLPGPIFPKGAWQRVNKQAGVRRIGPQLLRENFSSYAVSLGIPPAVAALWQGHSPEVQERHYRAQVLKRHTGSTLEEAMGLADVIQQMIKDA